MFSSVAWGDHVGRDAVWLRAGMVSPRGSIPDESLKEGGRTGTSTGSHKLRRGLIIGEFALALSLLAGAGLAIHSFWNLTRVDLGVRTDHVLVFGLLHPHGRLRPGADETLQPADAGALRAVPGVSNAAVTVTGTPLRGPSDGMPFTLVGGPTYYDPSQRPGTGFQSVSPDYYKTFGIEVVKGRSFSDQDTANERTGGDGERGVRESIPERHGSAAATGGRSRRSFPVCPSWDPGRVADRGSVSQCKIRGFSRSLSRGGCSLRAIVVSEREPLACERRKIRRR